VAGHAGRYGIRGATLVARKSGATDIVNSIFSKVPFNSPRTFYRHTIIDGAIKKAQAEAKSAGLKGKDFDRSVRENTVKSLQYLTQSDPVRMALAGVDMRNISDRLDKKLLQDPLKKFIADEAKRMKHANASNVRFGKEAQDELKNRALKWAKDNLYDGAEARASQLFRDNKSFGDLAKSKTELSASRAAKIFAGNAEGKKRYLQYLTDKDAKNKAEKDKAGKRWYTSLPNKLSSGYHKIMRDKMGNPKQMQRAFLRMAWQKENNKAWYQRSRFFNRKLVKKDKVDSQKSLLLDNISSGHNVAYARDRLAHLHAKDLKGKGSSLVRKRNEITDSLNSLNARDLMVALTRKANINESFNHKNVADRDLEAQYDRLAENYIEERMNAVKKMSAEAAQKELERLSEFALLNAKTSQQGVDSLVGKYSTITDANYEEAKASYGLAADRFEIKFGISLSAALLQNSDIGLKGAKSSDVFLGVAPKNDDAVDYIALNALKLSKNQIAAKMKMDKMNKQLNEFRINKLQEKSRFGKLEANEELELKGLFKENENLDRDIRTFEGEATRLDSDIARYGG